jgi:hypothetical protein
VFFFAFLKIQPLVVVKDVAIVGLFDGCSYKHGLARQARSTSLHHF